MQLIDTHIHLYLSEFDIDREELIQRASEVGINKFVLPNIDLSSIDSMLKLAKKHSGFFFPALGLHPCAVKETYMSDLEALFKYFDHHVFFGIGEIGLDLYWDKTFFEQQKKALIIQCKWAVERNLPVIIHTRDAMEETLEILETMEPRPRGILHCFSGNAEQAERAVSIGFFLGIGGVVTYKNSGLAPVVKEIPIEFLVLETDAPYLSPVPYRGKRNLPEYMMETALKLSELKGLTLTELTRITTENANRIFQFPNLETT